jgi:hypothetical protein
LTTLYGPEGKPITVNTGNDAGVAEANTLLESGYTDVAPTVNKDSLREVDGKVIDFTNVNNPRVVYVSDPKIITQVIGKNILDITDRANIKVIYTDPSSDTKVTVVDGQIIDYTDPNNVRVLYSGTPEIKTTTIGSVLLNITDPKNIVEMYKGPTDRKTTTINGQLIDYTDPANVQVLFGDKTRKYQTVNGKIVDITDPANTSIVFDGSTPDIRIIGRDAINFSNPANPQTIFTAPAETKTVTIQNNLLDVTDPKNIKILYKADPEMKTVTVEGQVINITDPTNPTVIYGDKTRKYQTVNGTIVDVTDPSNPVEVYTGKKEAGTSLERTQDRINDFATVEKFRNNTLNADDLNKFVSDIFLWTNPTLDINGNTTRQTMPPALIEALKYRYDEGMDTFGIPEDLFGVDSSGGNLTTFKSRIIDPNVSLTAATGLLSGLQRAINYAFEQTLGETPLGAGSTVFKDTSEGTKALLSLRQATSRFLIEGKTLAQEFADMKAELVDPSMFSSDIDALNALKAQRSLLTDQRARVLEVIKNPQRYTNPDKSKARELYTYAGQLLSAYDSAITSYQRGLGLENSGETSGRPPIDTFFRD